MDGYAESWLQVCSSPAYSEQQLSHTTTQFEHVLGVRPILGGSAETMRTQHAGLMGGLTPDYPPIPESVEIYDGTHGPFSYRVYRPKVAADIKLPIGAYYHPGGLVIGPSIADEYFCAAIAARVNSVIVAIKYRLSPEHKAPAHLQDALSGFEWASSP